MIKENFVDLAQRLFYQIMTLLNLLVSIMFFLNLMSIVQQW